MASIKNYRQFNHHNIVTDNPYYGGIFKIGCIVDGAVDTLPEPSANLLNQSYFQRVENKLYICINEGDGIYTWKERNEGTNDDYKIGANPAENFNTQNYYLIDLDNPNNYIEKFEYTVTPWIKNPQIAYEGNNEYINEQKTKDIYMRSDRRYSNIFIVHNESNALTKLQISSEHNYYDFQSDTYSNYNYGIEDEHYIVKVNKIYIPVNNAFGQPAEFYLDILVNEVI